MVTPQLKAHFQAQGIQIIPREEGATQVAALLSLGGADRSQCLVGNWALPPVTPPEAEVEVRTTLEVVLGAVEGVAGPRAAAAGL